jgi:hypothetical protein
MKSTQPPSLVTMPTLPDGVNAMRRGAFPNPPPPGSSTESTGVLVVRLQIWSFPDSLAM